ncbi:MAG: hypothetical protein FJ146_05395 [Deltaproteobacteria bacterium]|nr:hypothetical protein [Deltaproteobacteria bacterium]
MHRVLSRLLAANLLVSLCVVVGCGSRDSAYSTRSAFGENDIELVTSDADVPVSITSRFGLLVAELPAAIEGDSPSFWPICGALIIDARRLITNAHCLKDIGAKLHFLRGYMASPGSALEVHGIADNDIDLLRLTLNGQVRRDLKPGPGDIAMERVVAQNQELDLGLLQASSDTGQSKLELMDSKVALRAELYHFPNSHPLARSSNCWYVPPINEPFSRHDCDSLPGSSAGVLISADQQHILALHRSGRVQNSYRWFQEHQRFESADEISNKKCMSSESPERCRVEHSFNKAIALGSVLSWVATVPNGSN